MDEYLWEVSGNGGARIEELIEAAGVTRPAALVLAARGIRPCAAASFLAPSLKDLADPYLLPGTKDSARRLWEAIRRGERILVHGDYDTDGITASALVSWVLRRSGAEVECFIPHRIDDGYGLTSESVVKACEENWHLLLTVDCGITSYEAIEVARKHGLDIIVTDHHVPGADPVQATAVVDPKLPGSPAACSGLAGVGVAFKVCHAFLKYGREQGYGGEDTDLRHVLDLVALGTVADIVPLLEENRILVKYGLKVLSRQHRPGVHALCEISGVAEPVATSDITYRLAPRINATGRMGDPIESLHLLQASSMVDAARLARRLDDHNRERQRIEEEVVRQAEEQLSDGCNLALRRAIVVWDDSWHQGVVGIVASRLARRYHRPAVVLTQEANGQLTGSARSIRRLNLVDILETCKGSLTRYGGHAMAAGLSLEHDSVDAFRASFEGAVSRVLGAEAMRARLEICGVVSLAELDDVFFEELDSLSPFGHGNPEPVFLTRDLAVDRVAPAGRTHARGMVRDASGCRMQFIAFGRTPDELPHGPWDLVYSPQINSFGGQSTPQLRLLDVRPARGADRPL